MSLNTGFGWQPDVRPDRKVKTISPTKMRAMGLLGNTTKHVEDLEELSKSPPNIVIAQSLKKLTFTQNYFKKQTLMKGVSYIMGLGVYQQLHAQPDHPKNKFLKPGKLRFKQVFRQYKGNDLEDKTLLVFRTGGIGDLLFIQPNLHYLKKIYPTCKIKFACGPQYQSMVETWECVDEVLDLPFTLKQLQSADYHALFEGVIERCKLAEKVNAYNLFSEWLGLNLPDELLVPQQDAKKDKLQFCIDKLKEWNIEPKDFIVMQLRASSPIRTPRPQFWLSMINELTDRGHKILLTDNPRQTKHVDEFIDEVKNKDKVFNFCEYSLSLDYSIALTKLSKGVVATDSALNHIAASLDIPCYGIYGPFPGEIRLKTYPKARWVDAQKKCAPCYIHAHHSCPGASSDGFSSCYDNLDMQKTIDDIEDLIND